MPKTFTSKGFQPFFISIGFLLSLFSIVAYLYVSRPKVAYVRTMELVYGYNGMKQAHSEFKSQTEAWQSNIDTLERRYKNALEDYQVNKSTLSAVEQKERETLIARMQNDLVKYTAVVKEEAHRKEQESTEAVLNQVNGFIQDYAKKYGYDIVLSAETNGGILYGKESLDITKEVLAALNEKVKTLPDDNAASKVGINQVSLNR